MGCHSSRSSERGILADLRDAQGPRPSGGLVRHTSWPTRRRGSSPAVPQRTAPEALHLDLLVIEIAGAFSYAHLLHAGLVKSWSGLTPFSHSIGLTISATICLISSITAPKACSPELITRTSIPNLRPRPRSALNPAMAFASVAPFWGEPWSIPRRSHSPKFKGL